MGMGGAWFGKGKGRDLLMGGGGGWEGKRGRRDEVGVGDKEIGVQGERVRRRMGSMRGLWGLCKRWDPGPMECISRGRLWLETLAGGSGNGVPGFGALCK